MSQPPDIKAHLALHGPGVRVQFPEIGAVSISDIGMAKFLLAYPSAWASLDMVDPNRVAEASAGRASPSASPRCWPPPGSGSARSRGAAPGSTQASSPALSSATPRTSSPGLRGRTIPTGLRR